MYSIRMVWKLLSALVLIAVLAGCSAAPTPTPTAVPTIDTRPTFDAVSTQAAQTVVANLTLTAPTATPVTPTSTAAPTDTPAPTETPSPTGTATRVFIPWTKTPTATQAPYACSITSVSPTTSDTIKVSQDFDGKWAVKNTGSKTWVRGNTDIKFLSGTNFQKAGKTLIDMTSDVAPNGTYTVVIDMTAPATDGSYSTAWGISLGDGSTCELDMSINVTK